MTSKESVRATSQPSDVLVWDPLVRFGHWALATAFAVAFFSASPGLNPGEAEGRAPILMTRKPVP